LPLSRWEKSGGEKPEEGKGRLLVQLLSAAVARWIGRGKIAHRWCDLTAQNVGRIWRQFLGVVGDRPVTEIRPEHVENFLILTGEQSLDWERYRRSYIRSFFLWALRAGLIRRDPTLDVIVPIRGSGQRPFRTLTLLEEAGLSRCLRTDLRRYMILQITTGLRRGTLYLAHWSWVSEDWTLEIPGWALKNRRPLRLPLSARAIQILGRRGKPEDPLLPGLPHKDALNRCLRTGARRAGIDPDNLTSHQLRKTWVERFKAVGGSREECQLIQGWSSANVMLDHYWPRVPLARAREIIEQI
jgi:integrase